MILKGKTVWENNLSRFLTTQKLYQYEQKKYKVSKVGVTY